MTADDIVAAARAALDTPFQHQGRIAGLALDCAGLVVHVARSIGAPYTDVPAYGRSPHQGLLQATLDGNEGIERVIDRQAGDILLMRFASEPQHLAICAGDTMIHSYLNVGKVCEHRLSSMWAARIVAVYRFKGLA
ncbi:NlpC/P60 family protein [Glaciimonas sp. PCH181]|uniref:NlpC/P60 family protein n=1 Tax=Glaciimonas sp. PCH181 TaxID=2133943 RepID=UPI000D3ABB52|nr:NlpC/P60 family protein [Glaciimonas sp. PCH181]PUA17256.1 glycoside hydrolase [Glaciimonas sp. PCH181]